MAHKAKSYYLGATKAGKHYIVLYDNIEPTPAEQQVIDRFIGLGYDVKFEEKKTSKTVAEMLKDLKNDAAALQEFNAYYNKEKTMEDKNGKELQAFFAACKVYQEWVKKQKNK